MSLTPNRLTYLRIFLSFGLPLFLVVFQSLASRLLALGILILAAVTDIWDGILARKKGLVTAHGKLLDPIADKILILAALLSFVWLRLYSVGFVIPILLRELLVTLARLYLLGKGQVIAAETAGKVKTGLQSLSVFFSYLTLVLRDHLMNQDIWSVQGPSLLLINLWLLLGANVLTIYSGLLFFTHHWRLFFAKRS